MNQEIVEKLSKFSKSKVEGNLLLKEGAVCIVSDVENWRENCRKVKDRPEILKEMFVYGKEASQDELKKIRNTCQESKVSITFDRSLLETRNDEDQVLKIE